ncbi:UNVERIFIED_CONTAM: hypothetical protein Sradi_4886900 [Sesamum radiatum]|uniref:Uncharacterized protein n=1 Tax=Sesamum radiatum TaxID=300843 RepID=A0AAW2MCI1_SESRA
MGCSLGCSLGPWTAAECDGMGRSVGLRVAGLRTAAGHVHWAASVRWAAPVQVARWADGLRCTLGCTGAASWASRAGLLGWTIGLAQM